MARITKTAQAEPDDSVTGDEVNPAGDPATDAVEPSSAPTTKPKTVAKPKPKPSPATMAGLQPLRSKTEFIKAVMYGREGTGKSTAAAQASKLGKVLFIDSEGGLKVDALARLGADPDNILVWPSAGELITSTSLEELHRQLISQFADDPDFLQAIVVDSLTEIHHLLREQATEYRVKTSRVELDPDFVDRNDYGRMTQQLNKLIRRFRDLPCHVVFIALERDNEEDDGRKEYRPALTAALCTNVLGYADIVARFGSEDGSFRARFVGTERIRAKDRYGVLPEVLAEPGLDRIQAWINGELNESNDPIQQNMLKIDQSKAEEKRLKAEELAAKRQGKK